MTHNPLLWIGLGGVAPDDNATAHYWQQRLHWIMVAIALMSVPAYLLSTADLDPIWHRIASLLDFIILFAFVAEMLWMLHVSSFPLRYLFENWLNVLIILGATAAVLGAATEWIAIVRAMRAAVAILVVVRTATEVRVLFTRRGAPMITGIAFLTLIAFGAMFYWLDPSIKTFWEGLWLAFVTGTTVGYGDVVPTTGTTRVLAALMVLVGVSLVTIFTANVVAFFIGGEETRMRESLQRDIVTLRGQIELLLDAEELRITLELHKEIRALREELAEMRDRTGEAAAAARLDRPLTRPAGARASCLHGEERADVVGVHVRALALRNHFAARQHDIVVGERLREIVVLLDQQDRHLAAARQLADRALDVLDDRRLDALGRLVEDQQLRPQRQRAADRELLLLAAGKIAAAPAQHVLQHRKHLEDELRNAGAALLRGEAHLQVLVDGEPRKDLAALRHVADAEAARAYGGSAAMFAFVEADVARAHRQQPHQALEQRRLADAVAAEQRRALAGGHLERHVAQDVAAAVVLVEVRDGKHGFMLAAQKDFDDLLVLLHLRIEPSASTRPSCSTVTRSAMRATKSMSCSTTTSV